MNAKQMLMLTLGTSLAFGAMAAESIATKSAGYAGYKYVTDPDWSPPMPENPCPACPTWYDKTTGITWIDNAQPTATTSGVGMLSAQSLVEPPPPGGTNDDPGLYSADPDPWMPTNPIPGLYLIEFWPSRLGSTNPLTPPYFGGQDPVGGGRAPYDVINNEFVAVGFCLDNCDNIMAVNPSQKSPVLIIRGVADCNYGGEGGLVTLRAEFAYNAQLNEGGGVHGHKLGKMVFKGWTPGAGAFFEKPIDVELKNSNGNQDNQHSDEGIMSYTGWFQAGGVTCDINEAYIMLKTNVLSYTGPIHYPMTQPPWVLPPTDSGDHPIRFPKPEFTMQAVGMAAGSTYGVQASGDLVHWTTVTKFIANTTGNTNGVCSFTVPGNMNAQAQYYRLSGTNFLSW